MDMIGRDADHQANLSNGLPSEKDMPNNNSLNVLGTILVPSFKRIIKENNDHVNLDLKFQSDLRAIELFQRSDQWSFFKSCLLYTSPSPRDATLSRMPSSA